MNIRIPPGLTVTAVHADHMGTSEYRKTSARKAMTWLRSKLISNAGASGNQATLLLVIELEKPRARKRKPKEQGDPPTG